MPLTINFLNKEFKNPIIAASGTFGYGYEFAKFYDINILASIAIKGTTLKARYGNHLPRIAETPQGMINSIGLQNPGVLKVISEELVKLDQVYDDQIIANVGGHSVNEYIEVVRHLNSCDKVYAIELNISCPNVKEGGMVFGIDPITAYDLVSQVKKNTTKPLIVKLSPNVTDIVQMGIAVQKAGADAISLINTLIGMRLDLKTAKPIIANIKGGVSGPAIFPIALRMVYDLYQSIEIPIIGMGGISSAYDVIEMMYAGASLVMVGTANLIDPYACQKIIEELPKVMKELNINKLKDIIGKGH